MLRSLSLKLFVVCASVVSLAGAASAQGRTGTGPISPTGPAVQQSVLTDDVLEQSFRKIDPQCQKEIKPDGSKMYAFYVTRTSGLKLQTIVVLTPDNKMMILSKVKDAFVPSVSLEEVNRNLAETTKKLNLAPVSLVRQVRGKQSGCSSWPCRRSIVRSPMRRSANS